jgi:large subunit ribosomal protein L23
MNQERLLQVLLSPVISEKAETEDEKRRHFIFKVLPDATKREVGRAVEHLFEVQVADVRVLNVKGKRKRHGAHLGKRKDWRKAYVRLKPGYNIADISGA